MKIEPLILNSVSRSAHELGRAAARKTESANDFSSHKAANEAHHAASDKFARAAMLYEKAGNSPAANGHWAKSSQHCTAAFDHATRAASYPEAEAEKPEWVEMFGKRGRVKSSFVPVYQGEELFFVKAGADRVQSSWQPTQLDDEVFFVKAWMPGEHSLATKVARHAVHKIGIPVYMRATKFLNPHQSFGNSEKAFLASVAANSASKSATDADSHRAAGSLHAKAATAAPSGDVRAYHQSMGQYHRSIAGGATASSTHIAEEKAAPTYADSHLAAAKIHIGLQNAHLKLGNTADAAFHASMADHHLAVHNSQMAQASWQPVRQGEELFFVKAGMSSQHYLSDPKSRQQFHEGKAKELDTQLFSESGSVPDFKLLKQRRDAHFASANAYDEGTALAHHRATWAHRDVAAALNHAARGSLTSPYTDDRYEHLRHSDEHAEAEHLLKPAGRMATISELNRKNRDRSYASGSDD